MVVVNAIVAALAVAVIGTSHQLAIFGGGKQTVIWRVAAVIRCFACRHSCSSLVMFANDTASQ
jgi:hypothetical protein